MFGIELDHVDRMPVAGVAAPALGVVGTRAFVDEVPRGEEGDVAPRVPIVGRDEANRPVEMLGVVPADEGAHPRAGGREISKGLRRILGLVLQGAEERLGKRVVIAHARATEGREHPQALERHNHRGAFHGAAVVRVQ